MSAVAAILLAAGASRRFGSDKRLHRLAGGATVLDTAVGRYLAVAELSELLVVVRGDDAALAARLRGCFADPRLQVLCATEARLGMGHSLARAAACVAARRPGAVLVGLADMPFVRSSTIGRLIAAYRDATGGGQVAGSRIVRPEHEGEPGHPVLFDAMLLPALAALHGDIGARQVVQANRQHLLQVAVADAGVLRDVDRPQDLP